MSCQSATTIESVHVLGAAQALLLETDPTVWRILICLERMPWNFIKRSRKCEANQPGCKIEGPAVSTVASASIARSRSRSARNAVKQCVPLTKRGEVNRQDASIRVLECSLCATPDYVSAGDAPRSGMLTIIWYRRYETASIMLMYLQSSTHRRFKGNKAAVCMLYIPAAIRKWRNHRRSAAGSNAFMAARKSGRFRKRYAWTRLVGGKVSTALWFIQLI